MSHGFVIFSPRSMQMLWDSLSDREKDDFRKASAKAVEKRYIEMVKRRD